MRNFRDFKRKNFLSTIKQQIPSNQTLKNIIYNIDEKPIVLETNKPRKQSGPINNKMVQVKQTYMTTNPQRR